MQSLNSSSQIGRCHNRQSFRKQQQLKEAMEAAKKQVFSAPLQDILKSPAVADNIRSLQQLLEGYYSFTLYIFT